VSSSFQNTLPSDHTCLSYSNPPLGQGGAILAEGTLDIIDSTFVSNQVIENNNAAASGGALLILGSAYITGKNR